MADYSLPFVKQDKDQMAKDGFIVEDRDKLELVKYLHLFEKVQSSKESDREITEEEVQKILRETASASIESKQTIESKKSGAKPSKLEPPAAKKAGD
jgi:hypothetical protein